MGWGKRIGSTRVYDRNRTGSVQSRVNSSIKNK
ncbi:MAG: hypothetical protein ACI8VT_003113, partial [Saprospiraceae bacterium]